MFDDTIAAISTPPGEGGIGIVRLSGADAITITSRLFYSPKGRVLSRARSHTIVYGFIKDPLTGETLDEVLVTLMRSPHSYTREDVVEINCHGGIFAVRKVLELVLKNGARLAEPGEFTRRAFLNGRIDLSQAEAVIEIIRAKTEVSQRLALEQLRGSLSEKITALRERLLRLCAHIEACIDFPEDEIAPATTEAIISELDSIIHELTVLSSSYEEGRLMIEGVRVAIVGRPNTGKSSLLNALLKRDRAIVTETPGTTRDVLEELLNIKGLLVRIMDTAGIREAHDMAEIEGVRRSLQAIDDADLVIILLDAARPTSKEDEYILEKVIEKDKRFIIGINKSDLIEGTDASVPLRSAGSGTPYYLRLSAKTGLGLDKLKDAIFELSTKKGVRENRRFSGDSGSEGLIITNLRHRINIDNTIASLRRAYEDIINRRPYEIIAISLREGLDYLGQIVGAVTTEDILNRIFSEFCIGK